MCIAVPGIITGLDKVVASVELMGVVTEVNIQLIDQPRIGEYVLIHSGCAIEKIDKDYHDELIKIFVSVSEGDNR